MILTLYSYGPIGYEVIYDTIIDQVDAIPPNSFYPLSAERFVQFVLIPNITCQLVGEDKHIDLQVAYEVLIHSADVGEALQQIELNHEGIEDVNITDNTAELEMNVDTEEIPRFTPAERGVASPVGVDRRPVHDRTILVSSLSSRNVAKIHDLFNTELKDKH